LDITILEMTDTEKSGSQATSSMEHTAIGRDHFSTSSGNLKESEMANTTLSAFQQVASCTHTVTTVTVSDVMKEITMMTKFSYFQPWSPTKILHMKFLSRTRDAMIHLSQQL
jgi:hypothetical protein